MKIIKNIIGFVIAICTIPAIILTVKDVTELKGVKEVQFELLSEEEGLFNITPNTYKKLWENKRIKNYELESNYPLITMGEMERATWKIDDDLKNEIYIDENGQKRIRENVGQVTFDGAENWQRVNPNLFVINNASQFNMILNTDNSSKITTDQDGFDVYTTTNIVLSTTTSFFSTNDLKQYLSQNPLTVTYELAVKNPKTMVIESSDLYINSNYVSMIKPNDFSNNPDGLFISNLMNYIDSFDITTDYINIYPKDITVTELRSQLVGKTLTYELAQPRTVEVYDFSKFRLTYDKNRIRVVFDIDDEYYLWEITKDDKMIPINGQFDLGNIWTVKFYVYEIQQPLVRNIVLLIPLIVISGILFYLFKLFKINKEGDIVIK